MTYLLARFIEIIGIPNVKRVRHKKKTDTVAVDFKLGCSVLPIPSLGVSRRSEGLTIF